MQSILLVEVNLNIPFVGLLILGHMNCILSVICAEHSPDGHFVSFVLSPFLGQSGTLGSRNNLHSVDGVLTDDLQANHDIRHHKFAELFEMRSARLVLEHKSYHFFIESQHLRTIHLETIGDNNINDLSNVLIGIRLN